MEYQIKHQHSQLQPSDSKGYKLQFKRIEKTYHEYEGKFGNSDEGSSKSTKLGSCDGCECDPERKLLDDQKDQKSSKNR